MRENVIRQPDTRLTINITDEMKPDKDRAKKNRTKTKTNARVTSVTLKNPVVLM